MKRLSWLRAVMAAALLMIAPNLRADETAVGSYPAAPSSDDATAATPAPAVRRLPPVAGPSNSNASPRLPVQPSYPITPRPEPVTPASALPPTAAGVLGYYHNPQASAILAQRPQRPTAASFVGQTNPQVSRPFAGVQPAPTISPYLNLFRDEDTDNRVPNYFTLVRPQLEQQQTNRLQQRELARIDSRVRTVQYEQEAGRQGSGPLPPTGHGARFFNTGGYYGQPTQRR